MLKIKNLEFKDKFIKVNLQKYPFYIKLPYDYTKRIKNASKEYLKEYRLIQNGEGIHFFLIDEHISLEGLLRDFKVEIEEKRELESA